MEREVLYVLPFAHACDHVVLWMCAPARKGWLLQFLALACRDTCAWCKTGVAEDDEIHGIPFDRKASEELAVFWRRCVAPEDERHGRMNREVALGLRPPRATFLDMDGDEETLPYEHGMREEKKP